MRGKFVAMGSNFENQVPTVPWWTLNSMGSGAKLPELQSWICHLPQWVPR